MRNKIVAAVVALMGLGALAASPAVSARTTNASAARVKCEHGLKRVHDRCVCPDNLKKVGDRCVCPDNMMKVGDRCVCPGNKHRVHDSCRCPKGTAVDDYCEDAPGGSSASIRSRSSSVVGRARPVVVGRAVTFRPRLRLALL